MTRLMKIILVVVGTVCFAITAPIINHKLERRISSGRRITQTPEGKSQRIAIPQNSTTPQTTQKYTTNKSTNTKQLQCWSEKFEPELKEYYRDWCPKDMPPEEYKVMGSIFVCNDGTRDISNKGLFIRYVCTGKTHAEKVTEKRQNLVNEYGETIVARCFNADIYPDGDLDRNCMRQGFIETHGYAPEDKPQSGPSGHDIYNACYNGCMQTYAHYYANSSAIYQFSDACDVKCRK